MLANPRVLLELREVVVIDEKLRSSGSQRSLIVQRRVTLDRTSKTSEIILGAAVLLAPKCKGEPGELDCKYREVVLRFGRDEQVDVWSSSLFRAGLQPQLDVREHEVVGQLVAPAALD